MEMSENSDLAPVSKVQELLITLGLARTVAEVREIVGVTNDYIDFQDFLRILKDAQVHNPNGIKSNFLHSRTLHFEPIRKCTKSNEAILPKVDQSLHRPAVSKPQETRTMTTNDQRRKALKESRNHKSVDFHIGNPKSEGAYPGQQAFHQNGVTFVTEGSTMKSTDAPEVSKCTRRNKVYKNSKGDIKQFFTNLTATSTQAGKKTRSQGQMAFS